VPSKATKRIQEVQPGTSNSGLEDGVLHLISQSKSAAHGTGSVGYTHHPVVLSAAALRHERTTVMARVSLPSVTSLVPTRSAAVCTSTHYDVMREALGKGMRTHL
jgi:hypothetical protein